MACHEACTHCEEKDESYFQVLSDEAAGYKRCCGTECKPGYFRKDTGLEKMECLKQCPTGYYADEDTRRCLESWTVIGYQDSPFNIDNFTAEGQVPTLATTFNEANASALIEPLTNFFNLDVLDIQHSSDSGTWKVE